MIFWCLSLDNSLGWEFISLRGIYQNLLFLYSFYTTVVNDGLHEPYLLLTNSSFILLLSESHRGCLIKFGSNLSKFRSKSLKASLMSSIRSLFSDKARCFSQSERGLYENFIIISLKVTVSKFNWVSWRRWSSFGWLIYLWAKCN